MEGTEVGFTGTQVGMTRWQHETLTRLVKSLDVRRAHHGDCVGADEQFHAIVRRTIPEAKIVGHPPDQDDKRAFCVFDEEWEPKPYLERNLDIVICARFTPGPRGVLIATPRGNHEEVRSGTWSTIRRARAWGVETIIIWPDGTITEEARSHAA